MYFCAMMKRLFPWVPFSHSDSLGKYTNFTTEADIAENKEQQLSTIRLQKITAEKLLCPQLSVKRRQRLKVSCTDENLNKGTFTKIENLHRHNFITNSTKTLNKHQPGSNLFECVQRRVEFILYWPQIECGF